MTLLGAGLWIQEQWRLAPMQAQWHDHLKKYGSLPVAKRGEVVVQTVSLPKNNRWKIYLRFGDNCDPFTYVSNTQFHATEMIPKEDFMKVSFMRVVENHPVAIDVSLDELSDGNWELGMKSQLGLQITVPTDGQLIRPEDIWFPGLGKPVKFDSNSPMRIVEVARSRQTSNGMRMGACVWLSPEKIK